MRALSSLALLVALLPLAQAQDEVPAGVARAVKADIQKRGLPDAADESFDEQRFTRADGETVSPSGEALIMMKGVEELRGKGVVLVGLESGDYWTLSRQGDDRPIMNGPYRWREPEPELGDVPATSEIDWPEEPGADERNRLLGELADDVAPDRRRQITDSIMVSPTSWELVEARLAEMAAADDDEAKATVASIRRRLRREVRQLVQSKLASEVGPGGGFYDGQFAELARFGAAGRRSLLRILRDSGEDSEVRNYAAQALGEVGDDATVTELNDLLDSQGSQLARLGDAIVYALANLGDRSRIEPIIERVKREIKRSPDNARRYSRLAHIYVRMGDRRAAIEQYRASLERNPEGREAGLTHYNLACTYSILGMIDKAIENLRRAIELEGVDFDWMRKDGDLNNLHADPRWKELLGKREKKEKRRIF